jgi:hypothetical protein
LPNVLAGCRDRLLPPKAKPGMRRFSAEMSCEKGGVYTMLRTRLATAMVLASTMLMLASAGLLASMTADWERLSGDRGLGKLTANADRTAAAAAGSAHLTPEQARALERKWAPLPIAYTATARSAAQVDRRTVSCDVIGVSAGYREFARMRLTAGTTITEPAVAGHSKAAVISSQVADELFGAGRVVGQTIELYDTPFVVIGVFAKEDSLLAQMSDDGVPDVLVPLTTLQDVHAAADITHVELAAKPDAAVSGGDDVRQALTAIGANPSQYRIANGVLSQAGIAQYKALLLFVIGSTAIVRLVRLAAGQLAAAHSLLLSKLETHDWGDALRAQRGQLLRHGLIAGALAVSALGLWTCIRFRLYVPPEWIASELIDVSFYLEKLRSLWQQQVAQAGYVPAPNELLADAAGRIAVRLFAAGLLFGLPLSLLGIRWWALLRMPLLAQLQRLLLFVPAASCAAFAAARWAGTDYVLELRDAAVIGALLLVSALYFHKDSDKGENTIDTETENDR